MQTQQQHRSFPLVHANASRVHQGGHSFFEVKAHAFARAAPQQAWAVLTDYDRLAGFVPDLRESRLLSRNGSEAIIEQRSEAGFLFVSHPVRMRLRLIENPFSTIDVSLIEGDMRHYEGHWDLMPVTVQGIDGTHVAFSGEIEPNFFVPPFFGHSILQMSIRKMLVAVIAEIERRGRH